MIALVAALAMTAAPALPEGEARYRVELGGAVVGFSQLSFSCRDEACLARWETRLRLPAAGGGAVRARRVEAQVDRAGRLGDAEIEVEEDGKRRTVPGAGSGAVPLTLAELVLRARGGCIEVLDEETGQLGTACLRQGQPARVEVPGAVEQVRWSSDGFPEVVEIATQRARFVRDAGARLPAQPPPLEVRVAGPAGGGPASRFCGRAPDPAQQEVHGRALPEARPTAGSCREQAAAYAAALQRRGVPARIVLGVAHDGEGFVWHAWVEAELAGGWVAIDPAFGQDPARGPRFTVARHGADAASLAEAGRRVLECWGRGPVE